MVTALRTRRLWQASPFFVVAVLAVVVQVYAHLNPREYLSLRPVAESGPTIMVALALPVLLALGVLVGAPAGAARTATATVLAAFVLPVGCLGWLGGPLFEGERRVRSITTAARSSDGHWEVVAIGYTYRSDSDGYLTEFVLRSRAGLLSREAPRPLAGVWSGFDGRGNLTVVRVELPGGGAIELYTNDGVVHRTTFDPGSLVIADRFGHCADDPGHMCP